MDRLLILQHGLLYGLILSGVMTVLIFGSLRVNNELWLNDYPPDIQAKWGPMSPEARRLKLWVALPMFAVIIGVVVMQVARLVQRSGEFNFWAVTLSLWLSLMLFNLFDLLVIDWFFLMKLRPSFAILPGTEGMAGYSDYGFHFRGFLKGSAGITLAAPILAALAWAAYALIARVG